MPNQRNNRSESDSLNAPRRPELGTCRPLGAPTHPLRSIAWSPDGNILAVGLTSSLLQFWNATTGEVLATLPGHSDRVVSLAWAPDGTALASGSNDNTARVWEARDRRPRLTLRDHTNWVVVAWSPEGDRLATRSPDDPTRLWDARTGRPLGTLRQPDVKGVCLAWSPDGRWLASGTVEGPVLVWDVATRALQHALRGHSPAVRAVAWSRAGVLASAGDDKTVRLWEPETGRPLGILEGHSGPITGLAFSADGALLASNSQDDTIRLWQSATWRPLGTLHEPPARGNRSLFSPLAFHPRRRALAAVVSADRALHLWELDAGSLAAAPPANGSRRYRSAKVILVGDSGVGKSGLATVLGGEPYRATDSTHGRRVGRLAVGPDAPQGGQAEAREIVLWDLGGQRDYRLVHQLSLDDTSVALLVFDGSNADDPFKGVGYWRKALRQARGHEKLVTFLVAARADVSPLTVPATDFPALAEGRGCRRAFITSAKTGAGVADLLGAIRENIDWERLPFVVDEGLFKEMKDFVIARKGGGRVLARAGELIDDFRRGHPGAEFKDDEFRSALGRVADFDEVRVLRFADYVLLRPELLDNYASAVVQAARNEPAGLGFLNETDVREGNLDFGGLDRVGPEEERVILQAVVEMFVRQEVALETVSDKKPGLVFPSQVSHDRPADQPGAQRAGAYHFEGALPNVFATLVVRLHHSKRFRKDRLWKNGGAFVPTRGGAVGRQCCVRLEEVREGEGRLTVLFGPKVAERDKKRFLTFIDEHLRRAAVPGSVRRQPEAGAGPGDARLAEKMTAAADAYKDNGSKEQRLIGRVFLLVSEARQSFRPVSRDDQGIDGEIEFRVPGTDRSGNRTWVAVAEKIYVQLKSGGSYLRRRGDGKRTTFRIPEWRHIAYWECQERPVYLVVLDADDKMYWMDIRQYLRDREDRDSLTVRFDGEELTVAALHAARDRELAGRPGPG